MRWNCIKAVFLISFFRVFSHLSNVIHLNSALDDLQGDNIWLQIAECVKKTLLAIGPKMQVHWIIQVDWLTSCSKCAWKKLSQASRQMKIFLSLSGSVSCHVMFSLRNVPYPAPCPDSTIRFGKQNIPPARLQIAYLNVRSLSVCLLLWLWMLTCNSFFYGDFGGGRSNCRCRNWSPGQLRSLLRPLSRWGWKCLLVALLCCAAEMYRFCWGPSPPCNHPMVVSKSPESQTNKNTAKSTKINQIKDHQNNFPAFC